MPELVCVPSCWGCCLCWECVGCCGYGGTDTWGAVACDSGLGSVDCGSLYAELVAGAGDVLSVADAAEESSVRGYG